MISQYIKIWSEMKNVPAVKKGIDALFDELSDDTGYTV